ncbi:MAG TPA: inositol monophosphatase family protein [Acidimicrobiales bacterium]|nr:inositol monophosphatase family protein [Acidimicrobiales bacterium]
MGADHRELRDIAVAVAVEAADLLAAAVEADRALIDTKSSATDMVTEMDRASEALLVERLTVLRPDDAIVGEEGAAHPGTSGVVWVVDPLDGTTNYLYRYPGWNVSVGATVDGVPVAGAVVVPSHGDVFAAAAGHGATRNGRPLELGPPAPLATSLVATGFGYDPAARTAQAEVLAGLIARVRDVRRGGAAATDLCSVASGRVDAYYENGLAEWDRAAATVVAREAGARVEVRTDTPIGADCTIAAHPERFDEVVDLLTELGLLRGAGMG